MSRLHESRVQGTQYSTGPRLDRQKTEDGRCEMKEGKSKNSPLFAFSQNPLFLLVVNSSILTLSIFMDQQEIRVFGLACDT